MLMVPHKKIINKYLNIFDKLLLKNGKIFDFKNILPYKDNIIKNLILKNIIITGCAGFIGFHLS